jgi:hypothetical protein
LRKYDCSQKRTFLLFNDTDGLPVNQSDPEKMEISPLPALDECLGDDALAEIVVASQLEKISCPTGR